MDTIFDALGDAGGRDGVRFIVSSGYGSAPLIVDVQDIAVELLERFDITEHEAPDGN